MARKYRYIPCKVAIYFSIPPSPTAEKLLVSRHTRTKIFPWKIERHLHFRVANSVQRGTMSTAK